MPQRKEPAISDAMLVAEPGKSKSRRGATARPASIRNSFPNTAPLPGFHDKVASMYARETGNREFVSHLHDLYGLTSCPILSSDSGRLAPRSVRCGSPSIPANSRKHHGNRLRPIPV